MSVDTTEDIAGLREGQHEHFIHNKIQQLPEILNAVVFSYETQVQTNLENQQRTKDQSEKIDKLTLQVNEKTETMERVLKMNEERIAKRFIFWSK